MTKKLKSALQPQAQELIDAIKAYCESQVDLWRRVPDLALEADGRTGYSSNLQLCWQRGLWEVGASKAVSEPGRPLVSVDCASGKLVWSFTTDREPPDDAVLRLALYPDAIDAALVLSDLAIATSQDHFYAYDVAKQEAWRKKMRYEYQVKPLYKRLPRRFARMT